MVSGQHRYFGYSEQMGMSEEVTFDQRPEGNEEGSTRGSGCPRIHESFQEESIVSGNLLRWGLDMFEK